MYDSHILVHTHTHTQARAQLFRQLHDALCAALCNPFYQADTTIRSKCGRGIGFF